RRLEALVDETFGVPAAVVLRTFAELRAVAGAKPFADGTEPSLVAFLAGKPAAAAVRELAAASFAPDRLEVAGVNVFLHLPNGLRGSKIAGPLLERRLGPATTRNWRTVT